MKFHVNSESGEIGKCKAEKRNCPFKHFDNEKDANSYSEKMMTKKHNIAGTSLAVEPPDRASTLINNNIVCERQHSVLQDLCSCEQESCFRKITGESIASYNKNNYGLSSSNTVKLLSLGAELRACKAADVEKCPYHGKNLSASEARKLIIDDATEMFDKIDVDKNIMSDFLKRVLRMNDFDYCVSNPPYQKTTNGSNKDIWPEFIEVATSISRTSSMIHPGRWVDPKKNMQKVQDQIINSGLKDFYLTNQSLFKGVEISGGLSVTLFEENYKNDISYRTNLESPKKIYRKNEKFLQNQNEEELYEKLTSLLKEPILDSLRIGSVGSQTRKQYDKEIKDNSSGMKKPIKIWTRKDEGKSARYGWYWIEKNDLKNKNNDLLNSYKVMISKVGHVPIDSKPANIFNNDPMILAPGEINSGSQFLFPVKNKKEARQFVSMMKTKFIRSLMCLTQRDIYVRGFENIPDYRVLIDMLEEDDLEEFTDEWFYKKFNLSQETINYIESRITAKK